ncbi:MAG: MFS transporter, partial [Deltaproteobacteria bacterium]
PFSLWGAYLAWKVIPETRVGGKTAIDIPGALLLLVTNSLFIYAIDQLPRIGWRHPLFLIILALSVVALLLLLRAEAKAKTPILILSMFRSRLFSAGIMSLFLVSATLSAINFLLPFFLQNLLGYSPSQVGWIIVADSVIIMIMAPIAGALSDRLGSISLQNHFAAGALGNRLGALQRAQPELDLRISQPRKNRRRRRHDRHDGAHRRRHGRGAVGDGVRLSTLRRGYERQPNRFARKLARRT